MIEGGYTLWAKKTIESPIFSDKPHVWFKIWFFLVTKAQFSEDKTLPKGSVYIRYAWITESTKATKNEIDHFFRWAKGKTKRKPQQNYKSDTGCRDAAPMLATRKATHGMIVSLLKYNEYQDPQNYKSDKKSDSKATQKRHRGDNILNEVMKEEVNNTYSGDGTIKGESNTQDREGPTQEPPTPKKPAPHVEIVERYFDIKGIPKDQRIFPRFVRSASELLSLCDGNVEEAKRRVTSMKEWADARSLSWSLETVIKRFYEVDVPVKKKAFIEGCPAYQDAAGNWKVINHNGDHVQWIGSLDKLEYK